jgi:putative glutathione S-transferase
MGMLVDGTWKRSDQPSDANGRFVRTRTSFRDWITADGSSGYPPAAGRYHLYVSLACPWAHRTLVVRKLRKLDAAISLSVVDPFMDEEGWAFSDAPGTIPDTVNGTRRLREVYTLAQPGYTGRVTVPVLWDKETRTIVNNESREIIRMFDTAFAALGDPAVNFYPERLRPRIEETIDALYEPINNGVYRAGFARSQAAHEEAVGDLFGALEHWEGVLGRQRYLCGDVITEADWCLFTTLLRFDPVYHTHFKCNLRRIVDYPNLWNYLKELYQAPGVAETCNLEHIKQHYFRSHASINPTRIVPVGPFIDFSAPHDRARLSAA